MAILVFLVSAISKSFLTTRLSDFCARVAYRRKDLLAIFDEFRFVADSKLHGGEEAMEGKRNLDKECVSEIWDLIYCDVFPRWPVLARRTPSGFNLASSRKDDQRRLATGCLRIINSWRWLCNSASRSWFLTDQAGSRAAKIYVADASAILESITGWFSWMIHFGNRWADSLIHQSEVYKWMGVLMSNTVHLRSRIHQKAFWCQAHYPPGTSRYRRPGIGACLPPEFCPLQVAASVFLPVHQHARRSAACWCPVGRRGFGFGGNLTWYDYKFNLCMKALSWAVTGGPVCSKPWQHDKRDSMI